MKRAVLKFITFTLLFPGMAHGKDISFEEALGVIKNRSTDLPPAKDSLSAAESQHFARQMAFLPSLSAGYTKGEDLDTNVASDSVFLKANLNLFKGMSDVSNLRASKFNLFASRAQFDQEHLNVEAKATKAIVDYLQKSINQSIFTSFQQSKRKSLKTTQTRFKRGLTSRQEVMKAQVDLGIAKARVKSANINRSNSRATLITYLGHAKIKQSWPFKRKLKGLNLRNISSMKVNQDKIPELAKAKFQMMREEKNLLSSKQAFIPRLDFSYTMGSNTVNNTDSTERVSLLTLTIPLFSNWQTYSNYKTAQATLTSTKYQFESKKRDLESNWEAVKNNLVESIKTALEREQNLSLSRSLYQVNFKRFRSGKATVNDLQLDQNRLLDAESQASSGWAEAHLAYLDFCHTQGKSILDCLD